MMRKNNWSSNLDYLNLKHTAQNIFSFVNPKQLPRQEIVNIKGKLQVFYSANPPTDDTIRSECAAAASVFFSV
jgi:hypothetical protein